ncbi:hypothetical protein BGP78_13180 [Pseudoalteromonas sp. MSK9-3]|uniref:hypothetical protein n=1 Tax=Pseudoalteromonas sp. MSK9-3 TaxID=1897633 RepID=UPI000E6CDE34|nr:hypothetical protein [Pseudoalteromonas sp. MSK9-3]RJE76434.1 hypothetical protein BGP78_13180 [Pseudoalteromonas sp. MSK9-3]
MQPINSNNELSAQNVLYVGGTGSGKSSAVKMLHTTKATDQIVFWDPHEDYTEFKGRKVRRYRSFAKFFAALMAGRKTKQGFKIALTVPETRKSFLKFCEIVKGFGNGEHAKLLHVVCEEVPQVTESVGKEVGPYGWLLSVGRKFGFVVHSVGQRVVEMSKTTLSQSEYKWIGAQKSKADAKRFADEADIPIKDILNLKKLEYFFVSPGIGEFTKGKLVFKKKAA